MSERRVIVHVDRDALVAAVAERFVSTLAETCAVAGRIAHVALTGGSVGIGVLAAAATQSSRGDVPWERVHLWWGDERWVPRASEDRNERQAREAFIDAVAIPAENVHPFPASDDGIGLEEAAERYAAQLAAYADDGGDHPRFDITFLGVGPDGHVASLFPDRPGPRVTDRTVVAVRESPKPPPERLSLTLPLINDSRRVWLVLSGPDKASALGLALAGASLIEVPAAGVAGVVETVFYVDAAAAAEVPGELIESDGE